MKDLKAFFFPKEVAIIGASKNHKKLGYAIMRNFIENGFENAIPINPKEKEILGKKAYKSVLDITEEVDLAVIVTPAQIVPEVLEGCVKKKIKAVVIISGGFAEVGRKDLEDKVKEIVKKSGIRVIGPNCIGVMDKKTGVDTMFLPTYRLARPPLGSISFISQSGAVGSAIVDWCAKEGVGISKFISYGNAADVNELDMIEYLAKDRDTKVITAYLESTHDGRRLMELGRKISPKKPIIVLKAGRSKSGIKAVTSHTGSLAGSDEVYDAAFKQCGIIRAYNTEELFDFARAHDMQPLPKGRKIAIVTNGGGFGVIATDTAERLGLKLAEFKKETINRIQKGLPWYAVAKNPLDLVGDADAARYRHALEHVAKDPNVDGIICILLFQTAPLESEVVDVLAGTLEHGKPLLVCSAGGDFTEVHRKMLERVGIPTFSTPERTVKAMDSLVRLSEYLKK